MARDLDIEFEEVAGGVIAFIGGQYVSSFALELPDLPPRKLHKTLPFIMQDYLVSAPQDMAFCVVGARLVLACERAILEKTCAAAQARGARLVAIWPNYIRIAPPSSGVATLVKSKLVYGRRADGTGFAVAKNLRAAMVDKKQEMAGEWGAPLPQGAGFAIGAYGAQLPLAPFIAAARRPAAILAAALLVWLATAFIRVGIYERQAAQVSDATQAQFRAQFPKVKRVVNVEAQLRALVGRGGGRGGFLPLMQKVSGALAGSGIVLVGVEFAPHGKTPLRLSLRGQGFADLETARLALIRAGFAVVEGDAQERDGQVEGQFDVRVAS